MHVLLIQILPEPHGVPGKAGPKEVAPESKGDKRQNNFTHISPSNLGLTKFVLKF